MPPVVFQQPPPARFFPALVLIEFLWRPAPSMPYLFSDPVFHGRYVQDCLIPAQVFPGMLVETCGYRPACNSCHIDYVTSFLYRGQQVDATIFRNHGKIGFCLKFWPCVWACPLNVYSRFCFSRNIIVKENRFILFFVFIII